MYFKYDQHSNFTSFSKLVLAGWEAEGGWEREFNKSLAGVDTAVSKDSKSTSAAGLAGSGALTGAGLELGRGLANDWGTELTGAEICEQRDIKPTNITINEFWEILKKSVCKVVEV